MCSSRLELEQKLFVTQKCAQITKHIFSAHRITYSHLPLTNAIQNAVICYTLSCLSCIRRLFDDDDALNEVEPDAVPSEVRDWLAQTFTRSQSGSQVRGERPKFKSVAQAVRAGLMVDR